MGGLAGPCRYASCSRRCRAPAPDRRRVYLLAVTGVKLRWPLPLRPPMTRLWSALEFRDKRLRKDLSQASNTASFLRRNRLDMLA